MLKHLVPIACATLLACNSGTLLPYADDSETDTETEDTSSIELDTVIECLPRHEQGCGSDGHVHWFDSCGNPQEIAVSCDPNGYCDESGETATCRCNPTYEGDGQSCEPCACVFDGLCCDVVCAERDSDAPCDDDDPWTIDDACAAGGECIGADYCSIYLCPLPVPTGQIACFDDENPPVSCPGTPPTCASEAFCGQDSQYAALFETERLLELDTTIAGEPVIIDPIRQLAWPQAFEPAADVAAAAAVCDGLAWGGHDDWRVPTAPELLSLLDLGAVTIFRPYALSEALFTASAPGAFWSSTAYAPSEGGGQTWTIDYSMNSLSEGNELNLLMPNAGFNVRCVRDMGAVAPVDKDVRFVEVPENGDNVVWDRATGLAWQHLAHDPMAWENALLACEQSTYGGRDDWRLPNLSELASLVDFDQENPATVFPDAPVGPYWSSTTAWAKSGSDGFGWAVDFNDGSIHCGDVISDVCSEGVNNTIQKITRFGQKNKRTHEGPIHVISQCGYDRQEFLPSNFYVRCVSGTAHGWNPSP